MRAFALAALLIAAPATAQLSNPPVIVSSTPAQVQAAADAAKDASDRAAAAATAAAAAQARADAALAKATAIVVPPAPDLSAYALKSAIPVVPDMSGFAKAADLAPLAKASDVTSTIATVQSNIMAAMPQRATTPPPTEMVAPTIGTSMRYRGADDPAPRITRAKKCVLLAGGICTVTYEAIPTADPNVLAFPVNSAGQPIVCGPTAVATTTSTQIRCWTAVTTALNLGNVTSGVTLLPFVATAAGTEVQVTILPKN